MIIIMAEYRYFASQNNRYDLNLLRRSRDVFPLDAVSDLRYERWPFQHDLKPFRFYRILSRFDSDGYASGLRLSGLFDIRGMQFEAIRQSFDAISYHCGESFRFDYDFLIPAEERRCANLRRHRQLGCAEANGVFMAA